MKPFFKQIQAVAESLGAFLTAERHGWGCTYRLRCGECTATLWLNQQAETCRVHYMNWHGTRVELDSDDPRFRLTLPGIVYVANVVHLMKLPEELRRLIMTEIKAEVDRKTEELAESRADLERLDKLTRRFVKEDQHDQTVQPGSSAKAEASRSVLEKVLFGR